MNNIFGLNGNPNRLGFELERFYCTRSSISQAYSGVYYSKSLLRGKSYWSCYNPLWADVTITWASPLLDLIQKEKSPVNGS